MTAAPAVLVEIVRSGFVEGHHRGHAVVLDPDGQVEWSVGDPHRVIYPRSCNKPMQALGMLRSGLDLHDELLALAAASHSGEGFHLDGARTILARAGLDESALQCPPDWPLDDAAKVAYVQAGYDQAPIAMNCSGKHAAMLLTCVQSGWPTETYLDPEHPLQQAILEAFVESTGETVASTGTDGCGAPLFSASLVGLARAFAGFATAAADTPEGRIADAYRRFPAYVSGTTREETVLHEAVPGLICKGGAEACFGLGLADGRALAVKIDDGAARAVHPVVAELLRRMDVATIDGADAERVAGTGQAPLLGGGRPVGELRVNF